ncbi:MAG: amidohydrolase family protein [Acidobacteria bacterium]|nr:amidohydrolase family protein [Acidobacteriota bacterium]MBS1864887.1 amidohydrolase family protein [Acidobacteriota bacterium]
MRRQLSLAFLLLPLCPLPALCQQQSTVIINAQLADGTGAPLRHVNLRITGSRIAKIGNFKPAKSDKVLDAKGFILAPGFIDIHNHSTEGLDADPLAESQIAQGLTSLILGADGDSPWPIAPWIEAHRKNPASVNVAVIAGHATIRELVMGKDFRRVATPEEISKMVSLTAHAMHEGAIGLSSGLEYDLASYSNTDEVIAMAAEAAKSGGFYMTHIRDEGNKSFEALKEEIEVGKRAHIPIEHSHIKLGTVGVWHKAPEYIAIINDARKHGVDFLADCYPYEAWHSGIKVLMPDKQYQNPASVEKAIADNGGPESVTIAEFKPNPSYAGHTLGELAKINNISYVEMYSRIVREGDAANTEASIIGHSMIEEDVKAFYQQPWVMVASDGGIGSEHPRGAGTFPRVLGLYVREKKWITLPEAIRKMTSLPAKRLNWKDRGTLKVGNYADLVLFNPDTILDRATFEKPFELPTGIEKVFVNGTLVWDTGKATGAKPGSVLTVSGKTL